jgi:moderate conductance mechanosensitive channel
MSDNFTIWAQTAAKNGARLVVIAILAIVLLRVLRTLTQKLVQTSKSTSRNSQIREQQTRTLGSLLYSIFATAILVVAVLMALQVFDINVAPALATAGLASVAIAFGAQNLLKDLINGFFIVFEDQYVLGDLIQVNGEIGRVEHLTLRRTVIRNAIGAVLTIPNSLVGQVGNLSRDWSQIFVDVVVPAAEQTSRAISLLEKIAGDFRQDTNWSQALVDGPRVLGIESLALEGTVIRLQIRTVLGRKEDIARELRRRIKMGFDESPIPLAYTHQISIHGDVPTPTPQAH